MSVSKLISWCHLENFYNYQQMVQCGSSICWPQVVHMFCISALYQWLFEYYCVIILKAFVIPFYLYEVMPKPQFSVTRKLNCLSSLLCWLEHIIVSKHSYNQFFNFVLSGPLIPYTWSFFIRLNYFVCPYSFTEFSNKSLQFKSS